MNILITGSNGFIAKNFISILKTKKEHNLLLIDRKNSKLHLEKYLAKAEIIFHLAGANRSKVDQNFINDNVKFTKEITSYLLKKFKNTPIIFSSSILAKNYTLYGKTKTEAEEVIKNYIKKSKSKSQILRLTNIFGKWSKPNYNSVVATFSYNIARNKKINIFKLDSKKNIKLIYIDDLVNFFFEIINYFPKKIKNKTISSRIISVENLAKLIYTFNDNIKNNYLPIFNNTLEKNIYSTFISFFPKKRFISSIKIHKDERGFFSEVFKNSLSGQISYFTIMPKKIRGDHFHQSKCEIFLILEGNVIFTLKNIDDNTIIKLKINSKNSQLIHIPPGYNHKIKNISKKPSFILVWSNEIFSKIKPDTFKLIN